MTDEQHPIAPPPELVQQWWTEFERTEPDTDSLVFIATQAARWGADQELEACCEWVRSSNFIDLDGHDTLRAARRRPKPPSLKELGLTALQGIASGADDTKEFYQDLKTIKAALEALPND